MKIKQPKKKVSAGFSLVETLTVVAVLGIAAAIAVPVMTQIPDKSRQAKLNQDVRTVNSAVLAYLASGGDLDGITNSNEVISRLKYSISDEDRTTHVGLTGTLIDQRLAFKTADQVRYTPSTVAEWNPTNFRFEIAPSGSDAAVAEFYLSDDVVPSLADTQTGERSSLLNYSTQDGWVWDYVEATPRPQLEPTTVTFSPPPIPTNTPTGPGIDVGKTFIVDATVGTNIANNAGFENDFDVSQATRTFTNGEDGPTAIYIDQSEIDGWSTTASDGLVEIWQSGFNGVDAFEGDHFIEFNATEVSTLYQQVDTTGAKSVRIFFAHGQRARSTEQLRLYVGRNEPLPKINPNDSENLPAQGFEVVLETDTNNVGGWQTYSYEYFFEDDPSELYFAFQSIGEFSSQSIGNFLDEVSFQAVTGREVTGLNVDLSQGTSTSNVIQSATVVLQGAQPGDSLSITGNLPESINYVTTTDINNGLITLNIDGQGFRSTYENIFSKVLFQTSSQDLTSSRTLEFSANDGFATSSPATFELNL